VDLTGTAAHASACWRNPLPFLLINTGFPRAKRAGHVDAHDSRGGHGKFGPAFACPPSPCRTPPSPSTALRAIRLWRDGSAQSPLHTIRAHNGTHIGGSEYFVRTLKQTCSQDCPRAPLAFKDSMTHVFCNSHYVSHFAAFFIDVGAKISSVTSFILGFSNSFGCFRFWVLDIVCVSARLRTARVCTMLHTQHATTENHTHT
jgi:hypothetical protein